MEILNLENTYDLKLFAIHYIFETVADESDRRVFLDFVKESSKNQVEYLLLTGSMVSEEKAIISEAPEISKHVASLGTKGIRGYSMGYEKGVETGKASGKAAGLVQGGVAGVAAAAITALVAAAAYKIYKNYLSKAAKACKGKSGVEKKSCMNKFKQEATKKQISVLTSGKAKCAKSKDPQKCKQKIDKKINALKARLGAL